MIAWRDELVGRTLLATTIRHRLSALASLFDYLCDRNAVTYHPVKGVKRPVPETTEGKTPALGDAQARRLLAAPAGDTLKAKRDRAMLTTLLYHALGRDELCKLKGSRLRPGAPRCTAPQSVRQRGQDPVRAAAPGGERADCRVPGGLRPGGAETSPLIRPLPHSRDLLSNQTITPDGVYRMVRGYSAKLGFEIGAHSLRATAAINALDNEADIAKVQAWLGHANIATTRIYDHRKTRPEDRPTFKVVY